MTKDSSAKYYQKDKGRLQKKRLMKGIKIEEQKETKWDYERKRYKNLPEDGNLGLLSVGKIILKSGKMFHDYWGI